jgi:flagellar basal-body rod modification protein FlgD
MLTSGISAQEGRDQFLHLLVAQMRNQNPLEPLNNNDFMAQLAQFSTLEGIEKLNSNFSDMLALQQLTQGASLVGTTVIYDDGESPLPQRGTVDAVLFEKDKLQLVIQGKMVALDHVTGMVAPNVGSR